ncbi:MAG: hypothetical protein ACK5P5_01735 [Pseudobdellovibrionaceae bacterium]
MLTKSSLYLNLFLTSILAAGVGCSKENSTGTSQTGSSNSIGRIDGLQERTIEVVDEKGQPLQAKILIGDKLGSPFPNNFISTAANGKLNIPAEWTSAQPVTIDVPGYVRVTQLDQEPATFRVVLRKQNPALNIELTGNTTGFQTKDNDDKADFGIVLSTIKKSDILAFSMSALVSPQTDAVSVAVTTINLPSNMVLPQQKEKYSFVTVNVNKPKYRSYFSEQGPKTVFLARATAPFKKAADAGQNKAPVYEIINLISITGGQIKQVSLTSDKTVMDMNAGEFTFTNKLNYRAPQMPSNQVVLAVSAAELENGFLPADVRSANSGESLSLNAFANTPAQMRFLSVLKNKNEFDPKVAGADRFSAGLQNANMSAEVQLLPLLADPEVVNPQVFNFTPPNSGALNPLASTVLISNENEAKRASTPVWEVRARGWIKTLALPQFPQSAVREELAATGKVEMSFLASSGNVQAQSWDEVIQSTTHVTHSSKQY